MAKMTEEELDLAREAAGALNEEKTSTVHRLLAHIAALAAERDAEHDKYVEADVELGCALREAEAAKGLLAEMTRQRDALRERAQALEAERDTYKRDFEAELSGAAALREEHGAREGETFFAFVGRLAADSCRLAAIRQRAGDEAALLDEYDTGERHPDSVKAVARYILGLDAPVSAPLNPDATGEADQPLPEVSVSGDASVPDAQCECDPEPPGVSECPARCSCRCHTPTPVSELDGLEESPPATCPVCGTAHYIRDACPWPDRKTQPAEPTPAEAFATVREMLEVAQETSDESDAAKAMAALSLLERRMGALVKSISDAPHGDMCRSGLNALLKACNCWKSRAFTDAPEVYTREEVAKAFRETYIGKTTDDILRSLLERLAALRRTP